MPANNNKNKWIRSLAATWIVALAALAAPPTARAVMVDLNDLYADSSVVVSADGSTATINEDAALNPVFLSSFSYGTLTVLPGALFPVANAGQQFMFGFEFTEPAGNDDLFFVNLLDDAGSQLLRVFSTDAASTAMVTLNLDAFIGQTIGIEFGLETFDAALDSLVEISSVEVTAGTVVRVPEPATAALLLPGLLILLWMRDGRGRTARRYL